MAKPTPIRSSSLIASRQIADFSTDDVILIRKIDSSPDQRELIDSYVQAFKCEPWNENHSHDGVQIEFARLGKQTDAKFLGCFINDVLAGGAQFMPLNNFEEKARDTPNYLKESLFLNELFVHPSWQGKGLGTRILEAVEQAAASLQFRQVCLWTLATDPILNCYYQKRGYRAIATIDPTSGGPARTVFSKRLFVWERNAA